MNKIDSKKILVFEYLSIIIYTVLIFFISVHFDLCFYRIDDNLIQFIPVAESIYQTFLKTGRLAIYDFYQMRGMIVSDQGYYGQFNFLLFFSYILSKISILKIDTTSVYALLCMVIGNVIWNKLLKLLNISGIYRHLSIVMLLCSAAFIDSGYWYYVYNCYLIIPLLLYGIYRSIDSESKVSYVLVGIILAFSLTLGNVQYTFYFYMIYGIIYLICFLFMLNKRTIKYFISNVLFALILSFPMLFIMMDASARRSDMVTNGEEFFDDAVVLLNSAFNSLVPVCISKGRNEYLYNGAIGISLFVLVIIAVVRLIKIKSIKKFLQFIKDDKRLILLFSTYVCILFFIVFRAGKGYIIADLLYHIPVINQFRRLFKLTFIILPLSMMICAYVINKIDKKIVITIVMMFFSVLGIVNNYYITTGNSERPVFYNEKYVELGKHVYDYDSYYQDMMNHNMDLNNYRVLTFIDSDELFTIEHFDTRIIGGNLSTQYKIYGLGAYEQAYMAYNYNKVYELLGDKYSEYCIESNPFMVLFTEGNIEVKIQQLYDNSVKYLMFNPNGNSVEIFKDVIENSGTESIKIGNEFELANGFTVVELEGIKPIADSAQIASKDYLDEIHLTPAGKDVEYVNVAFSYNENIEAFYYDNRRKERLKVEDNNGDIKILINEKYNGSDIYIRYIDPFNTYVMYYGLIISILGIIFLGGYLIWDDIKCKNIKTDSQISENN